MLDKAIALVAPHHCCGCDKIGTLLCDNCKYNITLEQSPFCVVCKKPTINEWICKQCTVPYERIWVVGKRQGILQRLIGLYEFERVNDAYKNLGDLLLDVLPQLPTDTIVVPVPTTPGRIRERGYDHMLLIAKYIAKRRGLECRQVLTRRTNTKQRQASAERRLQQAEGAFGVKGEINPDASYLIIDDVMTTGATLQYAAKALREAGANHVWAAIIARQVGK
jgi:ComF family protein